MKNIDHFLFYFGIFLLFFCIFMIFIFFTPKTVSEKETLLYQGSLSDQDILNKTLEMMEPGDIILTKPKSWYDSYEYNRGTSINPRSKINNIFFYNLFDKIIIRSIGGTYWHIGIYLGDGMMNSLYVDNNNKINRNEPINDLFVKHKYFKVVKVKTSVKNKELAIKKAREHEHKKDIYYSMKNGLIIIASESSNLKNRYDLNRNELVCSSYVALLYEGVDFNKKPLTYITPVDIEFSNETEVKFLVNKTGFYIKK